MIDTGGTIAEAVKALKTQGAAKVYVNATHGLLSGSAVSTLAEAPLDEIAVTDTIYLPEQKQWPALRILSVAPLLASAIRNIHDNTSVSILFE